VVATIATIAGFNLSFVGIAYDVLSMIKSELLCACYLTFGGMLVCIVFLNNLNFGRKCYLEQLSITIVLATSNGRAYVGWPITAMSATSNGCADVITPIVCVPTISNEHPLLVAATTMMGQPHSLLLCDHNSDGIIVGRLGEGFVCCYNGLWHVVTMPYHNSPYFVLEILLLPQLSQLMTKFGKSGKTGSSSFLF
jgi:hypothetical protein